MECPRCRTEAPDEAHFCASCGHDLTNGDANRTAYAAKPDEPVASLKIVSTIMPRGAAARPRTYQYALGIALLATVITAGLGALPMAVMIAAFAIPIVYIVYLYDVNLWEDEPVQVTGMAFALTLVMAIVWTWLWTMWRPAEASAAPGGAAPSVWGFALTAVLVPIVGEAIRQLGPVYLAGRPRFDDMMDGLTFGVISGVAYATGDTLVKHWQLLSSGFVGSADAATWISLLVLEGFIKPLVIGTATGIACAEFSGLGAGYDGFTNRYFRAVADAIGANILFAGGLYLLNFVPSAPLGLALSIIWGAAILAFLIIRLRAVLHRGLMEAALEASARGRGAVTEDMGFCSSCEMPLLPDAAFCSACGLSVRAAGGRASVGAAAKGADAATDGSASTAEGGADQ